jgi:hypothetical protein
MVGASHAQIQKKKKMRRKMREQEVNLCENT